jgi:ribokinase
MGDILAFGSIVIDNVLIVNRFASVNETVQVKKYRYTYGGAGANVAVAVARLGLKSGIFAVSGYDFERMNYKKCLVEQGVDISGVIENKKFPMARSFIVSKEESENQILYYYENKKEVVRLLFENMSLAFKLSKKFKLLHFSTGHFEFYRKLLKRHIGKIISFDPGQETFTYPHRVIRLLKYSNLLFMNNHEAKRIKEILKIKSIRDIWGPKLICVSLGAEGSIVIFKDNVYRIPAVKPHRVVDPTGAGDSHRAGFLVALLKGYNVKTAARIASTVASFAIEAEGAQTSLPTWDKVVKRYEYFFREPFPEPQTTWEKTREELVGS